MLLDSLHSLNWKQAIAPDPLAVTPDTSLIEALSLMSQGGEGCVLVMEQLQLVGLLTEQEVIRLVATGRSLEGVKIGEVMVHNPVTLKRSQCSNAFAVLDLCDRHQIRYLPIVDDGEQVLGLATPTTLCRWLRQAQAEGRVSQAPLRDQKVTDALGGEPHPLTEETLHADADLEQCAAELLVTNQQLEATLEALQIAKTELERRVEERTATLKQTNQQLQAEIAISEAIRQERQWAEEALRESEKRLRIALEAACMGIWDWNLLTNEVVLSPSFEQLLGLETEAFTSTHNRFLDLIHPEDRDRVLQEKQRAIAERTPYSNEFRIVLPSGEIRWIASKGKVFYDATNRAIRMIGVKFDITLTKRAEAELRELGAALENAVEGISRLDTQGRYIAVNRAYANTVGYQPEEMIGMEWQRTIVPEDLEKMVAAYQQMLQCGKVEAEARGVRKDGSLFYKQLVMISAYDWQRQFIGHHCFMKDISDRRQAQELIFQREQHLAALVEVQRQLLAWDGQGDRYQGILETLAPVSCASRIYVFENHTDEANRCFMSQKAEWCGEGIKPEIDNPTLQNLSYDNFFPRWAQALARHEIVNGIVADFPESERVILEPQGILSILILPLTVNDECFGFIGFDNCVEARFWEESQVALLQAVAVAISLVQERLFAEAALRESEQKYRSVVDTVKEVIFQTDVTGAWTFLNPAWTEITGFSIEESLNTHALNYIHPGDRQRNGELLLPLIKRQQEFCCQEIRYLTKDGGFRWMEVFVRLMLDADGTLVGSSGTLNDMTQRNQAEEALRQSEEKFRNLVEQTNDWVWEIDSNTIFTYVNPRVREIIGYKPEELIGKTTFDFMAVDEANEFSAILQLYTSQQKPFINLEKTLIHKDGHRVILETSGSPVFDSQGILQGYRGISRDITKRKQVEQEIRKALMREKELGDLKSRFVSMTSHEFRTPLSIISSSAGVLEDYSHKLDEQKKRKHLQRIQVSVRHMTQLLEDVLVINRAEAGKLEFNRTPLDLVLFCRDLVEELQSSTDNPRMILQTYGASTLKPVDNHLKAWVDKKLLRQILTNLLSNAIKYSPLDSTIYFQLTSEDGAAVFQVRDEGIGISSEDQTRLFESFHRGQNVGNVPGTGLGLSIVKKCVEVHGGQITVTSEVGVGTTFAVTIPTK
jgi:PAS domain S-box-containing protein